MRVEQFWSTALSRSQQAQQSGSLVPLATETLTHQSDPFVIRRLLSRTPKHLRAAGPKPNPFLPCESDLVLAHLEPGHVLLLNKYPVQRAHLLVISEGWKPQAGWLDLDDWTAVARVNQDTSGLWFFNSCGAAGASQPHRHLQLLPRHDGEVACPLDPLYGSWLQPSKNLQRQPWCCALSQRHHPDDPLELADLYAQHCRQLGLGSSDSDAQPLHPYNVLFTNEWFFSVRRTQEHWAGFSVNALGFAGYLLATDKSDLQWLNEVGPWQLLAAVAAQPQ